MNTYTLSAAAIADLNEICDYLAQYSPASANELFDSLRQACKRLADFPQMGKSYDNLEPRLRGFVVNHYLVFYYPRADGIDVVRIVSGYRDLEALFN
jgi:toxin ParE1/3/4